MIDLVATRLRNQRLARAERRPPAEVVSWLGAVQAQDYAGAQWAIGLRANGLADLDVERAFNDGAILRTHVLRPTWHFVAPSDIRWMLALSAPRVNAANALYYRKMGLDERTFVRSRVALERALQHETPLTRTKLASALRKANIEAAGMRLAYLMMRAELDAVICSGPRRGNQFTYALLEERVPRAARTLTRDEALAELTRRYFTSHGPATVRDYAWWSGLTVRDAKTGIEMVGPALRREVIGDRTYWLAASSKTPARRASSSAHLLPNYDEYLIAYKDRGSEFLPHAGAAARGSDAFAHQLVIDGRLVGAWKRTIDAGTVRVRALTFRPLARAETRALKAAAERYGRFTRMTVSLSFG